MTQHPNATASQVFFKAWVLLSSVIGFQYFYGFAMQNKEVDSEDANMSPTCYCGQHRHRQTSKYSLLPKELT